MGKQFKAAADATKPVYTTLIGAAQPEQETPDAQEVIEAQEAQKTQGRKGFKALRINMAFTPSNSDYIRVMAGINGISMTKFINGIIARDAAKNGKAYQAAKAIIDQITSEDE